MKQAHRERAIGSAFVITTAAAVFLAACGGVAEDEAEQSAFQESELRTVSAANGARRSVDTNRRVDVGNIEITGDPSVLAALGLSDAAILNSPTFDLGAFLAGLGPILSATRGGGIVAPVGDPTQGAPVGDPTQGAQTGGDPWQGAQTGDPAQGAQTGDPTQGAPSGDPGQGAPVGDPAADVDAGCDVSRGGIVGAPGSAPGRGSRRPSRPR